MSKTKRGRSAAMGMDFDTARIKMVDNQVRPMDVTSHAVLRAFLSVPRERFVPSHVKALAYIDNDIEIAPGGSAAAAPRSMMQAAPLARLVQLAEIGPDDVVLEIGAGTGYGSAILSMLASSVVALECDEELASRAADTLSELGYDNVAVVTGALQDGYAPEAPYDVIVVNGSVEVLPEALFDQLRDGGRLVAVKGVGHAARAAIYLREGKNIAARAVFNLAVPPLPGFEREETFVF